MSGPMAETPFGPPGMEGLGQPRLGSLGKCFNRAGPGKWRLVRTYRGITYATARDRAAFPAARCGAESGRRICEGRERPPSVAKLVTLRLAPGGRSRPCRWSVALLQLGPGLAGRSVARSARSRSPTSRARPDQDLNPVFMLSGMEEPCR